MTNKKLTDLQYIINKTFKNNEYNRNMVFLEKNRLNVGLSNIFESVFGDELIIYSDNSTTIITDNWTSFKIKYSTNNDELYEDITMNIKKTKNSNLDTNAIIKFIKAYISPEEK